MCYYRRKGWHPGRAGGVLSRFSAAANLKHDFKTGVVTQMNDAWWLLQNSTLSIQQSREVDRLAIERYGMHSLVLMENAAMACAAWLRQRCPTPQPTTILCGRGNNGGDGLAIARQLTTVGWPCQTILLGPREELSADARANLDILTAGRGSAELEILTGPLPPRALQRLECSTVIIDALLGTGSSGPPREPMRSWLQVANQRPALRVAVDVPTGVDAQTGQAHTGHFVPTATLTFVARKPAMSDPQTAALFGEVCVAPIGIPLQMMHEIVSTWDLTAAGPGGAAGAAPAHPAN